MRPPTVLSPEAITHFEERGFVRLPGAFSPELALEMQSEIWEELQEDHGIERDDSSTWRLLPHSPRRAKHSPLSNRLAGERFQGAISDLLGRDDWPRPGSWGGFNVTFPVETGPADAVPSDTWHWDGSPTSTGLLIFSFYSSVGPGGGGTPIVSGSQRLISDYYNSLTAEELARPHKHHRKQFLRCDPWLEALSGQADLPVEQREATFVDQESTVRGVPCRVVRLTGEPGDAVFCNLGMLHAVARNGSDYPRFVRVKFLFLER